MADGFGTITWWGFSPALDLSEMSGAASVKTVTNPSDKPLDRPTTGSASVSDVTQSIEDLGFDHQSSDDVNILLIGAGDCRHILTTIARSYRYPRKNINFYILEHSLELYARHMLFLTIALEPQNRMGLQEKTELFLELYGNSLVRKQSADYVERMSNEFIKMVTDLDYLQKKLPIIDMSNLKYKERDLLEGIFKFWRNSDQSLFDIEKCWELRLRQHLGVRYDSIPNVFDWDYNMKLVDKGAGIIIGRNYSRWRHKGLAFEIREGTYDRSNKTLASGMVFKQGGDKVARRGYWGDIIVSPFISFGIESEKNSFFEKKNNTYVHSSEHVSEYNILSLLHEVANRNQYIPPDCDVISDPPATATLTEIPEETSEESITDTTEHNTEGEPEESSPLETEYNAIGIDFAKVIFLPLNSAPDLQKKSKFQKKFDIVYLSNSLVHLLNKDLTQTFCNKATIVLETSKFMLELTKDQHKVFVQKIIGMAQAAGCQTATTELEEEPSFVKFNFNRKS